VWSVP